jgi:hypothetical protein
MALTQGTIEVDEGHVSGRADRPVLRAMKVSNKTLVQGMWEEADVVPDEGRKLVGNGPSAGIVVQGSPAALRGQQRLAVLPGVRHELGELAIARAVRVNEQHVTYVHYAVKIVRLHAYADGLSRSEPLAEMIGVR